jgi:hypothetical protein
MSGWQKNIILAASTYPPTASIDSDDCCHVEALGGYFGSNRLFPLPGGTHHVCAERFSKTTGGVLPFPSNCIERIELSSICQ